MNRAEFTRKRNWNKLRLMGITINKNVMTDEEKEAWNVAKNHIDSIIENYDQNSQLLGLNIERFNVVVKAFGLGWDRVASNLTSKEATRIMKIYKENNVQVKKVKVRKKESDY